MAGICGDVARHLSVTKLLPERRVDPVSQAFVAFERVRDVALATLASLALLSSSSPANAQKPANAHDLPAHKEHEAPWYERIHLRGYTQVRYNRLFATNPQLKNDQGDRSIGDGGGFLIRRARLIFTADLGYVGLYLQPDFASTLQGSESLHVGQIRDWWGEVFLNKEKEFRIRVGQQKVPFGWELMQSSSNRLPLDRTDALNSAFANERDLGAFLMYEPPSVRKLFRHVLDAGLKGSGDYGMASVGVSNGQPLNTRERNDNKHFFARLAVPFEVGSQIFEVAGGGYTGLYVIPQKSEDVTAPREIRDFRLHGTLVWYPQPIGFQAEYNFGRGPELAGKEIVERPLSGGYVMTMVRIKAWDIGYAIPFVRLHQYDGGKKFERDSPRHEVREINAGVEWQFGKWLELVTEYMGSERTVNGKEQTGKLFRLQLQFNY